MKGIGGMIAALSPQAKAFVIAAGGLFAISKGIQTVDEVTRECFKSK